MEQYSPIPSNPNLNRQVFDKTAFNSTIDTSFSELGVEEDDPSFFDINQATIDDFFTLYEKFFFEFASFGDNKSHEYFITKSSNYINFSPNKDTIQALLNEIVELRQENLELLETYTSSSIEIAQIKNKSIPFPPPPPPPSTPPPPPGAGTSGGGYVKIICNELYSQGFLSETLWEADEKYGDMMVKKNLKLVIGYQMWARKVINIMKRSPNSTKIVYWLVKPWTKYMGYQMGVISTPTFRGKLLNLVGTQFSYMVYNLFNGKHLLNKYLNKVSRDNLK